MTELDVKNVTVGVRMPKAMVEQCDLFAARQGCKRGQAIRELLRRALKQARVAPPE